MNPILIKNASIINEGSSFKGHVLCENGKIARIFRNGGPPVQTESSAVVIEAGNLVMIPGVIDDQVHFREPGLTHKGDISSESKAAVAGGITSYMEMPNTIPPTITNVLLKDKIEMAAGKSWANFSFYLGASNDNINELMEADPLTVCGIKVFMGSST